MNSADAWHESNDVWPHNPDGDMSPILQASVQVEKERRAAAIARHPSGKGIPMPTLTAHDRCDGCGAAALYRVADVSSQASKTLDFCGHHYRKHSPNLLKKGWTTLVQPEGVVSS
ncbi:DUF7455 domain-containing protein [Streptomyces sp. NPDC002754]